MTLDDYKVNLDEIFSKPGAHVVSNDLTLGDIDKQTPIQLEQTIRCNPCDTKFRLTASKEIKYCPYCGKEAIKIDQNS